MKRLIKSILTLGLIGLCTFISLLINFGVLFPVLFPDPEKYAVENNKKGTLFSLFIDISSNTGYHPEPSIFYFIFVYCIGIVLGSLIAYKYVWKNSKLP